MGTIRSIKLTAVFTALCVSTAGAATIGINIAAPSTTGLDPAAVAGVASIAQSNWNNITAWSGTQSTLVDSTGAAVAGLSVTWSSSFDWGYYTGPDWGFSGDNLTMVQGVFVPGATITVTGIPYAQYDVYAYAEDANGSGGVGSFMLSVAPAATGSVNATQYYYRFTGLGGNFVQATTTTQVDAAASSGSNYALFTGNSATGFTLTSATNSWGGISALQIVDTTPIPEPATLGAATLGLLFLLRRRF